MGGRGWQGGRHPRGHREDTDEKGKNQETPAFGEGRGHTAYHDAVGQGWAVAVGREEKRETVTEALVPCPQKSPVPLVEESLPGLRSLTRR